MGEPHRVPPVRHRNPTHPGVPGWMGHPALDSREGTIHPRERAGDSGERASYAPERTGHPEGWSGDSPEWLNDSPAGMVDSREWMTDSWEWLTHPRERVTDSRAAGAYLSHAMAWRYVMMRLSVARPREPPPDPNPCSTGLGRESGTLNPQMDADRRKGKRSTGGLFRGFALSCSRDSAPGPVALPAQSRIQQEITEETEGSCLRSLCSLMFKSGRASHLTCRSAIARNDFRQVNHLPYAAGSA